jgi:hypothetical protein
VNTKSVADRAFDEVGLLKGIGVDRDVRRQRGLQVRQRLLDPFGYFEFSTEKAD